MSNARVVAAASAAVLAVATPTIMHFEGKSLVGYHDVANIITACYGHTKTAELGKRYTDEQCKQLLEQDLKSHDDGMRACIKTPISTYEHAAYLSFTYNVGVGSFCKSTLVKKLNAGDRAGACAELSRWILADGKVYKGLERRRATEREQCERGARGLG